MKLLQFEKVMHARSGAWRCCDGKRLAARVQCEPLLAATFIVLCWTLNLHWYVLLGSSKKITSRGHWITAFSQINAMPFLPYKGFALTGRLKTANCECCEAARIAKCECLRSRANCQVWMFVKQPNRRLQQLLAVENKTILQQLKPSTLYMMFQLTQIFYPYHTGMRSEMLHTNGSFEICQERMFVKQHGKNGWSIYLLPKKIFVLKQK